MGKASQQRPVNESGRLLDLTLRGYEAARNAAADCTKLVTNATPELCRAVKEREEELDTLDREINEGVTEAIMHCRPDLEAREMLACLKLILDLERIGDLLLSFANRALALQNTIQEADARDLTGMTRLLEKMMADAAAAFRSRDTDLALQVLRADMEVDRLRNLLFMRHIENPENTPRQGSFHLVFMSQALERAGDHAKNLAEEVIQLVTGRSPRHLLRAQDRPDEVRFVESLRQKTK
jgi:phosphate transport system protein